MNQGPPPDARLLAPRYDPAFLAAESAGDDAAWRALTRELHPRVHALPFLDPAWCRAWSDDVEERAARHAAAGGRVDPPNGLHAYGVVLTDLGYGPLLDELLGRLLPLTRLLFPEFGGATLDHHHGFLVDYSRGRDEDLPFHVDDSEVTLNLCLAGEFAGSELYFEGLRCDAHRQSRTLRHEHFALEHEPGVAVLHAGVHRHGVDPLRHGQRRNLILWCRSSAFRASGERGRCGPWCGAHAAAGRG